MTLSDQLAPLLPYLRRYARALTGSQESGDAYVAATLESIVAAPAQFPSRHDPRLGLYQVFHAIWSSASIDLSATDDADADMSADERAADRRLANLTSLSRQALLLTVLEGFSQREAGMILDLATDEVAALVSQAIEDIDRQTICSVLIIEDEPIIAMDLEQIVSALGHRVTAIAATRDAAVRAVKAEKPGLVLADIQLADGSSGIDAVRDILGAFEVPVIFITAYPERLLTGRRPEPTFLITKPFRSDTVRAAVSQALFFERASRIA